MALGLRSRRQPRPPTKDSGNDQLTRGQGKEGTSVNWEKAIGESLDEIWSRPVNTSTRLSVVQSGLPTKEIQPGMLKPFHLALMEQLESYADDDLRGQEGGRKLAIGEKEKLYNKRGQSSSTTRSDHRRLICESCGTVCQTMAKLCRHMRCHSLSQLSCTFCSKKFTRKQDMEKHVERMHKRSCRFACGFCPKRFADSSGLRRHQRVHLGIKPHSCSKCGRKFTSLVNLRSHLKTQHNGNTKGVKPILPMYQMTRRRNRNRK